MKIAVVIPTLDEAEAIAGAVGSVLESVIESAEEGVVASVVERVSVASPLDADPATPTQGIEVWVVDGGSRDETVARARAAGARVLASRPGRARQLEAGFRASGAEVVLFLHADTRLAHGWAAAVRSALRDPGVVGGAFRLRFAETGWLLRAIEAGVRLRVAVLGLPYGDQAIFVRRRVLEEIGGVPDVPLLEDLDLVRALKARGRVASLALTATTSARRYLGAGVLRTLARHSLALLAWRLGIERARVAAWYAR